MPGNDWKGLLAEAAAEVLETMFFTPVGGAIDPGHSPAEPRLAARLCFEGTPSGALTLSVSESAVCALSANFLAPEDGEQLPGPQLGGVVCELANMICGSLLSRVSSEEHFRLSSPELLPDGAACPPGQTFQSLSLGEDGCDGAIDLWLALEPHAA